MWGRGHSKSGHLEVGLSLVVGQLDWLPALGIRWLASLLLLQHRVLPDGGVHLREMMVCLSRVEAAEPMKIFVPPMLRHLAITGTLPDAAT